MSLLPIANAVEDGKVFFAAVVNSILGALRKELIGRDSSGNPSAEEDLGTETYKWKNFWGINGFLTDLTLGGIPVVKEKVGRSKNGIISSRVRTTSGLPDFIRADGATNAFTILATTTPLKVVINNEIVTISTDIIVTGLTSCPSYTDATVGLTVLADYGGEDYTKYLGEEGSIIVFESAGTIPPSDSQIVMKNVTSGEYIYGLTVDGTGNRKYLSNSNRGWFFDSAALPNSRDTLTRTEVLEYLHIGYVFIQNNGTTVDTSYVTPIYSDVEPTLAAGGGALVSGQYWKNQNSDEWERYSGSVWEILNRTLIGVVIIDQSGVCIGSRSIDFDNDFDDINTFRLKQIDIANINSDGASNKINIYGKNINHKFSNINWNLPADLETGVEANTRYYVYNGNSGEHKLSIIRPHHRSDLLGRYHPFNSWRCLGYIENVAGDIDQVQSELDLSMLIVKSSAVTLNASLGAFAGGVATVDNKSRWDDVNYRYQTIANEWYSYTLSALTLNEVGFTGTVDQALGSFEMGLTSPFFPTTVKGGQKASLYSVTNQESGPYVSSGIIQGAEGGYIAIQAGIVLALVTSIDIIVTLTVNQISQVK